MIAQLLILPPWFVSPDDKPSYELFQSAINNSSYVAVECKTIEAPTLSELVIQTSCDWANLASYNYVNFNGYYYVIEDANYVSANNNVVQFRCQIDIYLSFLVYYFKETNSDIFPVFFLQKHLNRFEYLSNGNINYSINPAKQFYLLNLHEQLGNIGSKKIKQVYTTNNFNYFPSETNFFADDNYFNVGASIDATSGIMPTAYPVVLWQMTANSTVVTTGVSNIISVYPFPYALGSIGLGSSVVGTNKNTSPFQFYFFLSSNADLGNQYYADVYLFPISLNYLLNQAGDGLSSNTLSVYDFTGWNYSVSATSLLVKGYNSQFDPVILLSPTNHLYACVYALASNTTSPDSLLFLSDEPALINYANFNTRMYGQDNHIDLSGFILYSSAAVPQYLNGLIGYLASFCITISPPNMMLTNIPYTTWIKINSDYSNWCGVWNYNDYNDAIYSCQLKATAPSASTNWADYMAENKKSYDMSLNVSQLLAQNAQANIKVAQAKYGGSIASYDNVASDILSIISGSFGNKVASTYADSIGANILAPNDAAIQQDKLNYMRTGMKADYTRTSNMRTSAISTINTLYDSTFCLAFECPPIYEQIAVINYYALYGYKLERWVPFNYWNNRKLCNYVKIANFTNAVIGQAPFNEGYTVYNAYYRGAIDSLLNKGVRIWNNAAFPNNYGYGSIPYNHVIMNNTTTYKNTELNENNDELNYLINNNA